MRGSYTYRRAFKKWWGIGYANSQPEREKSYNAQRFWGHISNYKHCK